MVKDKHIINGVTRLWGLTPIQKQYRKDRKNRIIINPAGRRAKKTLIGSAKIEGYAKLYPNTIWLKGAPTREQAKEIFWDKLKRNTKPFWYKWPNETALKVYLKNGSTIRVVGLDKAERLEGKEADGIQITEMGNCKPGIWDMHLRPILSDEDRHGIAIIDGVPEGQNDYYDMAMMACDDDIPIPLPNGVGGYRESKRYPGYALYTWMSQDVLNPEEIRVVKAELDEQTFRQEYEGAFIDMQDSVYYAYSRANHTDKVYNPSLTTWLTFDFNLNPMTCTVIQRDGELSYAVKEFIHYKSNTRNTGLAIEEWLQENIMPNSFGITGDNTGIRRATSGIGKSDWDILEEIFSKYPGYIGRDTRVCLNIKNRINAANCLFETMSGKRYFYLNPKECPHTDKSLFRTRWKPNRFELDSSGKIDWTHASDNVTYYAFNIDNKTIKTSEAVII